MFHILFMPQLYTKNPYKKKKKCLTYAFNKGTNLNTTTDNHTLAIVVLIERYCSIVIRQSFTIRNSC